MKEPDSNSLTEKRNSRHRIGIDPNNDPENSGAENKGRCSSGDNKKVPS
jgi:hypothetical protein